MTNNFLETLVKHYSEQDADPQYVHVIQKVKKNENKDNLVQRVNQFRKRLGKEPLFELET